MSYQDEIEPVVKSKEARKQRQWGALFRSGLIYLGLTLGAITMIAPFLWMITTSLSAPGSIFSERAWWKEWIPTVFYWKNYIDVWSVVPFGRFYVNSVFISVALTAGQVVTSSMAAYAFARLDFPGRDKIFFGYLGTMMIPGAVTMIPVFVLLRYLGWIDTYQAMILPGIFTAYGTFMLRQFFLTLPKELEDAAKIDGCSYLRIFWHIILPLSGPALATLTTFTFMGSWMSLMWPLIVVNSASKFPLPVGLSYFQGLHNTNWELLMAATVMMMLPILIVFVFSQRFFVEGIKLSGIKG